MEVRNLVVEINASKLSCNVPWSGVTTTVTLCIMELFVKRYTEEVF